MFNKIINIAIEVTGFILIGLSMSFGNLFAAYHAYRAGNHAMAFLQLAIGLLNLPATFMLYGPLAIVIGPVLVIAGFSLIKLAEKMKRFAA